MANTLAQSHGERAVEAYLEAMDTVSPFLPGTMRTMRLVIEARDTENSTPVAPLYDDDRDIVGFRVYPCFVSMSAANRAGALRRALAAAYMDPIVQFARKLVDSFVVNPDVNDIVNGSLSQIASMAARELASTFQDVLEMQGMSGDTNDIEAFELPVVRAEA